MEYRQEKKIEQYLTRKVKELGGLSIKITSPGMAGVPDRLVLYNGRAAFVELKSSTGKASARQQATHRLLDRVGFPVAVLSSKQAVDAFVWGLGGDAL